MDKGGTIDQFELRSFVEGVLNKDFSVVIAANGKDDEIAENTGNETLDEISQEEKTNVD